MTMDGNDDEANVTLSLVKDDTMMMVTTTNRINFDKKTPIDDKWTDNERLENIAKYCGYSVDAVRDFIFEYVNDVKNKYLKR